MDNILVYLCYLTLAIATCIGVAKFPRLSTPFRVLVILLLITAICEAAAYSAVMVKRYDIRYEIYHLYNPIQAILLSAFYIFIIAPAHQKALLVTNLLGWPLIALLNAVYLQPVTSLNSNMLIFESFFFITLSLYFIYITLKYDVTDNVFRYPYFWVAVIWLISWSSSMFFWACIKLLYRSQWRHMPAIMYMQAFADCTVYAGIAIILYNYNRKSAV